jgi:uncharacterized protein (UPF0332 family)
LKKEIRLLIEKAGKSILAAQRLAEKGFGEFAVSRAYYAMFYCAEALLLSRGLTFSKHSGIISAFGKEFIKTKELPEELHAYILDAFKDRQKADYEAGIEFSEREVKEIIQRANNFLKQTKQFLDV